MVRISADAAQFTAGMRGAAATARSAAAAVQGFGSRIEGFAGQVGGAVAALTAGWVGGQTFGALQKWFEMFSGQQETFIRLEATLRSQGVAVDETVAKYREFAAQVAATTTTSATAATSLLTQAATFRAVGATGIAAARDALALSAATGVNAEAVLRLTAAEAQGDTQRAMHMARVLPQLRFIKDQAQFQSEYNKLVAAGTEAQQKLAGTAAGQLTQLGNLWSGVQRQLGSVVADGLKPMVELARMAAGAFGTLSQSAREAVVIVLAVTAAGVASLAALGAGVFVLGTVFNLSFGGAGILIGLVVTGLGLASAGAVALVRDVGGIKATFEALKAAALAAWDWLAPVRVAIADLWKTVQELGTQAWVAVKQAAVNAWQALGLGKLTWDQVRAAAVDAVVVIEFGLTHVGQVAEFAWTAARLGALTFWEELKFTFTDRVPAVLRYFQDNWQAAFKLAADVALLYFGFAADATALVFRHVDWNLLLKGFGDATIFQVGAAVAAIKAIPDLVKSTNVGYQLAELFKPPRPADMPGKTIEEDLKRLAASAAASVAAVRGEFDKMPPLKIPGRILTQAEQEIRALYEAQKDTLAETFADFRAHKLREFAAATSSGLWPKPDPKAPPASWAPHIEAAKHALQDLKGVLAGTAEDFALLEGYRLALHGTALAGAGKGAMPPAAVGGFGAEDFGGEFGGGIPVVAVNPPLPGGGKGGDALPVLKRIAVAVEAANRKPGIDVQAGMGLG